MGDVCSVAKLSTWQQEQCQSLAQVITKSMSANNYDNRENLEPSAMCKSFWSVFLTNEEKTEAKEAELKAQQEKEAAAAQAAHEAEEAKKEAEAAEAKKQEEAE